MNSDFERALVSRTNGAPAVHGTYSTDSVHPLIRLTEKGAPRRTRDQAAIDPLRPRPRPAACLQCNARHRVCARRAGHWRPRLRIPVFSIPVFSIPVFSIPVIAYPEVL